MLLRICERDMCPRITAGMPAMNDKMVRLQIPKIRLATALPSVLAFGSGGMATPDGGGGGGMLEVKLVGAAAGVKGWPQLLQKRLVSGLGVPQVLQYMRCKVELIAAGVNRKGLAWPSLFPFSQI